MERATCTKVFCIKYLKRKRYKICFFFHKFSVQDHLHEDFCTFKQFSVILGFVCMALINFFFHNKTRDFGWRNTDRN